MLETIDSKIVMLRKIFIHPLQKNRYKYTKNSALDISTLRVFKLDPYLHDYDTRST